MTSATATADPAPPAPERLSSRLETWAAGPGDHTVDGLVAAFGRDAFALVFLLLLAPSALPLPTGGATNVFEVLAFLIALQLLAGRTTLWLPRRWRAVELAGRGGGAIARLLTVVRYLERHSRPRLRAMFDVPFANAAFGLLVIVFTAGAFLAPPFSGLDTLPSLGVVLLAVAVLLEDGLLAAFALLVGAAGLVLELAVGQAILDMLGGLL